MRADRYAAGGSAAPERARARAVCTLRDCRGKEESEREEGRKEEEKRALTIEYVIEKFYQNVILFLAKQQTEHFRHADARETFTLRFT